MYRGDFSLIVVTCVVVANLNEKRARTIMSDACKENLLPLGFDHDAAVPLGT
jgi:hypothetical protein